MVVDFVVGWLAETPTSWDRYRATLRLVLTFVLVALRPRLDPDLIAARVDLGDPGNFL